MPKNHKKRGATKKGAGAGPTNSHPPTDDESVAGDNWSTTSAFSEGSQTGETWTATSGDEQEPEETTEESTLNNVLQIIDGLTEKSGPTRVKHLKMFKHLLSTRYLAECLEDRTETTTDCLLKCLKRGKGEEQTLAAECIGLLSMQMGPDLEREYETIQNVLATYLAEKRISPQCRAQCAVALAMWCFMVACAKHCDVQELEAKMRILQEIFNSAYSEKNGSLPHHDTQMSMLNTRCLDAWCMLLTQAPPFFFQKTTESLYSVFKALLQSPNTDMRIASGKALALMIEVNNEDFLESNIDVEALCNELRGLSTESTKHFGKHVRRQQRASFRDILQSVEDGEAPVETIMVGKCQNLILDTWTTKIQYEFFCDALQSGIDLHLQENLMLREFFDLGAPLPTGQQPSKVPKTLRRYYIKQADKARTIARGKTCDKRSAVHGF